MINIIPQTEIRLLKVPLEKEGNHTLSFNNINNQLAYFLSKTIKTYSDFTYQRESASLVVGDPFDTINTCNYLMYRNNGFSNKYFYAYITKMEYISENSTRIYFEIDSLQTWYFNINYKECFVEREHVNNDTIGLHTVPENLETGEYINGEASVSTNVGSDISICVATSKHIDKNKNVSTPNGKLVNNIFQGLDFAIFSDYPSYSGIKKKETAVYQYMYYFEHTTGASADDIIDIFMIPTSIIGNNYTEDTYRYSDDTLPFKVKFLTDTTSEVMLENYLMSDSYRLAGNYQPVNNKLLTFPFRYILASNGTGQDVIYKWEDFTHSGNNISFKTYGDLTPNCSMKCIPQNYKGITNNYEEAINYSKYPTCSWIYDAYTNWMTQNNVNSAIRTASGLVKIGTSIAGMSSGNAGSSSNLGSGAKEIFNVAMEQYQHQFDPNQARGNISCGDINFTMTKNNIQFYKMSIKPEYARIIDSILSMYGYKVSIVKVPNITGRANWNYVKTIGCNFTGNIPQEDIEKIRNLFNNGITFWHNEQNFLNYSDSNGII